MNTVKKTVIIFIDIPPIDHASHEVFPHVTTYAGAGPMEGHTRKTLALTIDVPVRFEELPSDSVKEITSEKPA